MPNIERGYKVVNNDLFALTRELNKKLLPLRTELMAKELLDVMYNILDYQRKPDDPKLVGNLLLDAIHWWEAEQSTYSVFSRSHDPIEFRLNFLEAIDSSLLATAHVNYAGGAYVDMLKTFDTLEAYDMEPDWLDEDNPDDAKELQRRERNWRHAVGDKSRWDERPHYQLPNTLQPYLVMGYDKDAMFDAIELLQRSPERRLRWNMVDTVFATAMQKIDAADGGSVSRLGSTLSATEEAIRGVENIADYGKLPERLTQESITTTVNEYVQTDFQLDSTIVEQLADEIATHVMRYE